MKALQARMLFSRSVFAWLRKIQRRLLAFSVGESGGAAIFFALSSPVWLGGLALGAEVGSWYYFQQRLQGMADAVAASVAARAGTGASEDELWGLASTLLYYSQGENVVLDDVDISAPSNPSFKDERIVTVKIGQPIFLYLTRIFQQEDVFFINARATARVNLATEGCVLALDTNGQGVTLNAPANVHVSDCEVLSNGNFFTVNVGANLETDCIRSRVRAHIRGTANLSCGDPKIEAGVTVDPYADLPNLGISVPCAAEGPVTIASDAEWSKLKHFPSKGREYVYLCSKSPVTLQDSGAINIPPKWTFIVEGADFTIQDTSVVGADVSFFFTGGGRLRIDARNSAVKLTADASGMLFRSAKVNSIDGDNLIAVGPGSKLEGAIYFPNAPINFSASGNVSECLQIIGQTVELSGAWQIAGPCAMPGISPIVASRNVNLTQ